MSSPMTVAHSAQKSDTPTHPFQIHHRTGPGRGLKFEIRVGSNVLPFARESQAKEMQAILAAAWAIGRKSVLPEIAKVAQTADHQITEVMNERNALLRQMADMELVNPIEDAVLGGLRTRLKGKLIPLFSGMFADLFVEHGGIHYVTFELEDDRLGPYELTIAKVIGKSPAQQLADADRLFDRVINVMSAICPGAITGEHDNPTQTPTTTEGRAIFYVLKDVKAYRNVADELVAGSNASTELLAETMPIEFAGFNATLAKDQPQYRPLPCHVGPKPEGRVTSCWKLSDADYVRVVATRQVFVQLLTFGQPLQPLLVMGAFAPPADAEFKGEITDGQ